MQFTRNKRELQAHSGMPNGVIGLTGGIGSGKSVAESALKANGFTVIDADEISRRLFAPGSVGEKVLTEHFPQATVSGRLDRKKLRDIIAADKTARCKLNELTHPAIIAEVKRAISSGTPPIVLSAPLLFETPLASLCDRTVCVYCPKPVRINRIIKRDGITRAEAERIIGSQIPDTERCTVADYIVPSDREMTEFEAEIVELFRYIAES